MYVSDYYYAAGPSAWTLVGYNSDSTKDYRAAKTTNWLFLGSDEWTISRNYGDAIGAFSVYSGSVSTILVTTGYAARPVFNLLSSTSYVSGSGSMSDPVRVN